MTTAIASRNETVELINKLYEVATQYGTSSAVVDYSVKQDLIKLYEPTKINVCFVDNILEARVISTVLTIPEVYIKHEKELDAAIEAGVIIPEDLINSISDSLEHKVKHFKISYSVKIISDLCLLDIEKELSNKSRFKELDLLTNIVKKCFGMIQVGNMFIVINHPEEFHFDEDKELHNENGPAIKFRRGTESDVYAIHGKAPTK